MLPATREKPAQLVPNSYAITTPETTPIPKPIAKIFDQNWNMDL